MTRYTSERGYGLDLSGPEPVWRGRKRRWTVLLSAKWLARRRDDPSRHRAHPSGLTYGGRQTRWGVYYPHFPRHRIDDYIKKGLIDPARRDDL